MWSKCSYPQYTYMYLKTRYFFWQSKLSITIKKQLLLMWQLCKAEASTLFFIYFWLCASYNKIVYMYLLWILLWNFEPSETCHSTLFFEHMITFVISKIIYFIFILSHYICICKSVINNYRFENMYAIFVIWVHCYIRLLYSGILVEKKLQRTLVRFSKKKIVENIDTSLCM